MRESPQNVGPLDRATRIVLGAVIIAGRYFFRVSGIAADIAVLIGAILIWEGLLGYCLLYGLFGWSTKHASR
jgi:hypothetical protein